MPIPDVAAGDPITAAHMNAVKDAAEGTAPTALERGTFSRWSSQSLAAGGANPLFDPADEYDTVGTFAYGTSPTNSSVSSAVAGIWSMGAWLALTNISADSDLSVVAENGSDAFYPRSTHFLEVGATLEVALICPTYYITSPRIDVFVDLPPGVTADVLYFSCSMQRLA